MGVLYIFGGKWLREEKQLKSKNKSKKNSNYGYKKDIESKKATSGEKGGRRFSIKRKIPLSLVLALVLPLTVCFFGPFELYCGNIEEFLFSLGDFFPLCIATSVAVSALLFALLLLLDGVAYIVGCAIVAWLTIAAFLQRYYMNSGIDALVGDGVGTAVVDGLTSALNALVWIAIGGVVAAGAVLLVRKKRIGAFFAASALLLIVVLCMQTVGFAALSFTSDAYTPVTERNEAEGDASDVADSEKVLTHNGISELSKGKNIVFFLVDRFDAKYYREMVAAEPEFFDSLDGFTYFDDYTSLYCRTYPGVMSILTGKEYDPSKSKDKNFKDAYSDGGHLKTLYEHGYKINVYSERSYVYNDASVMDDYVSNVSGVNEYYIDSKTALCGDMLRLSLSEYLPVFAKDAVGYMSTPDFNAHAIYKTGDDDIFMVDEESTALLYERLQERELSTVAGEGRFTFIHLFGCHDTTKTNKENVRGTFELIYSYIEEMKELGVYEDATIVITGDHSAALSDSKLIGEASSRDDGTRVTAMLFKRSGDAGTPLVTSTAQISQDELWATIYESEGLLDAKDGDSFFDIPEGEDRERRYFFEMYKNSKNNDLEYNQLIEYKIIGTANDGDNWSIVSRTDIIK